MALPVDALASSPHLLDLEHAIAQNDDVLVINLNML
jgi:hypothetical protein